MTKRLLVLTGAKQNLGDFLITDRCRKLLEAIRPDLDIEQVPGWEEPPTLSLARADALAIMGGPGFRPTMIPDVYPLAAVEQPVLTIGVGWKGPTDHISDVQGTVFSSETLRVVGRAEAHGMRLSCRDYFTYEILRLHDLAAEMTGCPAWYDLDFLGKEAKITPVRRIAVSAPASADLTGQLIEVVRHTRSAFPRASVVVSFHHGFEKLSASGDAAFFDGQRRMRAAVEEAGCEIADLGGSLAGVSLYDEIDLHVGYRVHAHIYRLSRRAPSILVWEDGRGAGVDDALGIPGARAYRVTSGTASAADRTLHKLRTRVATHWAPTASDVFRMILERAISTDFESTRRAAWAIDATFPRMKAFLEGLLGGKA